MIELVTTEGIFALDGGEWAVTNNVWLIGNDREVIVIDAAHDASPIVAAVHGRRVRAIALTHGHNDHINAAVALQAEVDAPILLHPDDRMLWRVVYPDRDPDGALVDGGLLEAGGAKLGVLHTPGHSPGGCCFHLLDGAGEGARCGVHRRHLVLRRARCDGPQLQRLRYDRRLDSPPLVRASRQHRRSHRPRRRVQR